MNNGTHSGFAHSQRGTKPRGGFWSGAQGRTVSDDARFFAWPADDLNSQFSNVGRYVNTNLSLGTGKYSSAFFPGDRGFVINAVGGNWVQGGVSGWPFAGIFNTAGNIIFTNGTASGASSYAAASWISNYPGMASSLGTLSCIQDNMVYNSDTPGVTIGNERTSIMGRTIAATSGSGTLTATTLNDFVAKANISAGVTVTTRNGFRVLDNASSSAGTITNQYGLKVEPLNGATNNYPIGLWQDDATTYTSTIGGDLINIGNGSTVTLNFANAQMPYGLQHNPTIEYSQNAGLGVNKVISSNSTVKNTGGVTANPGSIQSFVDSTTVQADNATVSAGTAYRSFYSTPSSSVINGGTLTGITYEGLRSSFTIGDSTTVTTRTGIKITDAGTSGGGTGSLTTQYGIDIDAFSKGSTNVGIRNKSTLRQTTSATFGADATATWLMHLQGGNSSTAAFGMDTSTTGPTNHGTNNGGGTISIYHGATNYYLLVSFNNGGTQQYKYIKLNDNTTTAWQTGTSLPT